MSKIYCIWACFIFCICIELFGGTYDTIIGKAERAFLENETNYTASVGKTIDCFSFGPEGARIEKILCAEEKIIVGTASSGIYQSWDTGRTWEQFLVDPNFTPSACINDITISQGHLLAATGGGIYKSFNSGISWENIFYSLNGISTVVEVDPFNDNIIYNGRYRSADYKGFYVSDNGGLSWQQRNIGLRDTDILCLTPSPFFPGELYVGTVTGLFMTKDRGLSGWTEITHNLSNEPVYSVAFSNSDSSRIWVGTNKGLYSLKSNSNIWINSGPSNARCQNIRDIYFDSNNVMYLV